MLEDATPGVKRQTEESSPSSPSRPAKSKAKPSKPDLGETVRALNYDDATQPKAKAKSPTKKAPEDDHPKTRGRPKTKEEDAPKPEKKKEDKPQSKPVKKDVSKEKVVHGTKIEILTFDEWHKEEDF